MEFVFADNTLFFGCRGHESDFYFEKEWSQMEKDNSLKILTAFSRDQEEKIYVQHRITEDGEYLWKKIKKNACIYVAGYG